MCQLNPIAKSVSVSFCVRVVRACVRAKLCERAKGGALQRWGSERQDVRLRAWGVPFHF